MANIAFVVQRYGPDVNGGAEQHCLMLAQRLAAHNSVTVITTTALSASTWQPHFPQGQSIINGVTVLRFNPDPLPDGYIGRRHHYSRKVRRRGPLFKLLRAARLIPFYEKYIENIDRRRHDVQSFIDLEGGASTSLLQYISSHAHNYDVFIFFTYHMHHSTRGIPLAAHKAIFIPLVHSEAVFNSGIYKQLFSLPRAILYNTAAEERLVTKIHGHSPAYTAIAGVGINIPAQLPPPPAEVLPYLLYAGRISIGKGCPEMLRMFIKYKQQHPGPLSLILAGTADISIPQREDIKYLGFVSDAGRDSLMAHAAALVIPSRHESLSLVTLESMALGTPVIANAQCEVLKDHITQSAAGELYTNTRSFIRAINTVLANGKTSYASNGKNYVSQNYQWPAVMQKVQAAINYVTGV